MDVQGKKINNMSLSIFQSSIPVLVFNLRVKNTEY